MIAIGGDPQQAEQLWVAIQVRRDMLPPRRVAIFASCLLERRPAHDLDSEPDREGPRHQHVAREVHAARAEFVDDEVDDVGIDERAVRGDPDDHPASVARAAARYRSSTSVSLPLTTR